MPNPERTLIDVRHFPDHQIPPYILKCLAFQQRYTNGPITMIPVTITDEIGSTQMNIFLDSDNRWLYTTFPHI